MVKTSRKRQSNLRRGQYTQKNENQLIKPVNPNRAQPSTQIYDASKYIKYDIKRSAISAGIVLVVLAILYVFFH